jgi:oleate hydratase
MTMNIYKTMYRPKKPKGIEGRKAYIVGGGLAGLATATFLVDDAGMPGKNITILERFNDVGGCCDGVRGEFGYLCRGEREMEPFMECLWYLYSKIPSLENKGRTVLDDIVDFNRDEPIHSEARILTKNGEIYDKVHDYKLEPQDMKAMAHFMSLPESALEEKAIEDFFGPSFFRSSLWLCFHSCLAFKTYHSAIECRRYFQRFAMVTRNEYLEGIIHTKYDEYDAMIKPLMTWLSNQGVKTAYGCSVYDLTMDEACNTVQAILFRQDGQKQAIDVGEHDLVFATIGSLTTNNTFGDNHTVAKINRDTTDLSLFTLWQNLAKKDKKFGNPDNFLGKIDKTKWMSFFPTIKGYPQFVERLERLTGSKAGTGGAVTLRDSSWDISFVLHHKPFFPDQADDEDVLWADGLYGERLGDYVKKPMAECTGNEIMTEFLYQLNMLDMKDELLKHTYVSTCMMPYIGAHFMPRKLSDCPNYVPDRCTNLGLLGQYVEHPDDASFTVELSVRTAMETVYKLTGLEKDVLEVYPSRYDVRYMLERIKRFAGIEGRPITVDDLPNINPLKINEEKEKIVAMLDSIPPYYTMYLGRDRTVPLKRYVLHPEAPKMDKW